MSEEDCPSRKLFMIRPGFRDVIFCDRGRLEGVEGASREWAAGELGDVSMSDGWLAESQQPPAAQAHGRASWHTHTAASGSKGARNDD